MEIFSSYFKFQISTVNARWLKLERQYCKNFEVVLVLKKLRKLEITYYVPLVIDLGDEGLKIFNPSKLFSHTGITHLNTADNTAIIIFNPTNCLEIFIAEKSKGLGLNLYQQVIKGYLVDEMDLIRGKAQLA